MGMLKTVFDLNTVRFRPNLQKRISEELLFEMPRIGMDPVIILGATRATALIAQAAVEANHKRFIVIGGKEVGNEDPRFTRLLAKSLEEAGLPLPSRPDMKEHEYGREVLRDHFGIANDKIITRDYDDSTNMQQNMEVLARSRHADVDSLEIYTLAGTARRVIGTARKVLKDDQKVIAAHNVFPTGITRENWMRDIASSFYALSEADKVLSPDGKPSEYEKRGFCRPVHMEAEIARVRGYVEQKGARNGPVNAGP